MDIEVAILLWRMLLLSMSSFLSGCTITISWTYYRAWKRRDKRDWRGLLPLHVATIALSYNLLLVYSTIETWMRIGTAEDAPLWRAVVLIPAYGLGFVAMRAMWKLRRRKRLVEIDNI